MENCRFISKNEPKSFCELTENGISWEIWHSFGVYDEEKISAEVDFRIKSMSTQGPYRSFGTDLQAKLLSEIREKYTIRSEFLINSGFVSIKRMERFETKSRIIDEYNAWIHLKYRPESSNPKYPSFDEQCKFFEEKRKISLCILKLKLKDEQNLFEVPFELTDEESQQASAFLRRLLSKNQINSISSHQGTYSTGPR